jgi:hypothetical protein
VHLPSDDRKAAQDGGALVKAQDADDEPAEEPVPEDV